MLIDLSPRGLATILFKNFALISTIILGAIAAALLYFFFAPNIYQANATLLVRFGNDVRPELQLDRSQITVPSSRDEHREAIESNLRIMQSRELALQLVAKYGVDKLYPELLSQSKPKIGTVEEAAVSQLEKAMVVKAGGTQANVIEVAIFHKERNLAIQLTQSLIDMAIAKQSELYENPQIEFTAKQMNEARQRLETLQNDLNGLRQASGIFDYDKQFEKLLQQQGNAQTNLSDLSAQSLEAEGRQARLEAALGSVPDNVASGVDAEQYKELDTLRQDLEQLRNRAANADPSSPMRAKLADKERVYQQKLRELQARNRTGANDVYQTMVVDYIRSSADAEASRRAMDFWKGEEAQLSKRIIDMQADNQKVVDASREVELADATYRALKRQFDDASVSQSLNDQRITRLSVIDAPFADPRPARPRKFLTLVAALVGSLLAAASLVVVKESMSNRIYLPEHIERMLNLKVITSFGRFNRRMWSA